MNVLVSLISVNVSVILNFEISMFLSCNTFALSSFFELFVLGTLGRVATVYEKCSILVLVSQGSRAVVCAVLLLELHAVLGVLGRRIDDFDVSQELR